MEVSGAVRHIYVIRRLKVNVNLQYFFMCMLSYDKQFSRTVTVPCIPAQDFCASVSTLSDVTIICHNI